MELTSSMFGDGQPIPERYTKEGDNISPPLNWSGAPVATTEFALVCEDLDAQSLNGPFVHWLVYGIPADHTRLPEGLPNLDFVETSVSVEQGRNSFSEVGYGGPKPPRGSGVHRYCFTLYALNSQMSLEAGLDKATLLDALDGHILGRAQLVGTYEHASPANVVVDHQMTG